MGMISNTKYAFAFLLSAALCVGCGGEPLDDEGPEDIDEAAQSIVRDNSMLLNGTLLNGIRVNGIRVNGIRVNGIRVNGVQLSGTMLSGIRESDGAPMSNADFSGSDVQVVLADTSESTVRIEAVTPSGTPGLNFYTVTHYVNGMWENICPGGVDAIPLGGVWDNTTATHLEDPDNFTFACRGAALAKCAEWGYERWGTAEECTAGGQCHTLSLAELHEACTRMVRADYCGDGVPHTQNGTTIDVWDAMGIQDETPSSGLAFEAEWTANGAACIQHTRWADSAGSNPDKDYILTRCPERWAGPENPNPPANCGTSGSDFFTQNGYGAPLSSRRLLRNASANNLR